jgi:hypothetical protein
MSVRGGLDVVYLNKQGQNLLDQSTPNYYSVDKMKLYFLEKGKKTWLIIQRVTAQVELH